MNKVTSNRIVKINFFLSCWIVLLHSNCLDLVTSETEMAGSIIKLCSTIADAAVPTFFMMSAMLFFRNFSIKLYETKLRSRIASLLCPYLLWNIMFMCVYMLLYFFPQTREIACEVGISADFIKILKGILSSTFNSPLWYLRVLFLYVVVSPLIYIMIKKKIVSIILVVSSIGINMFHSWGYSSPIYWLPVYLLGAIIGVHYFDRYIQLKFSKALNIGMSLIIIIMILIAYKYNEFYTLYRYIIPVFILLVGSGYNSNVYIWEKQAFFMYCTHSLIVRIVKVFLKLVIDTSCNVGILSLYFGTALISIIVICCSGMLLKRIAPKIYGVLLGNR